MGVAFDAGGRALLAQLGKEGLLGRGRCECASLLASCWCGPSGLGVHWLSVRVWARSPSSWPSDGLRVLVLLVGLLVGELCILGCLCGTSVRKRLWGSRVQSW